ncbi:hypothetical protein H0H81_001585 [Sphagnurus paluster]|uniref:Uncharacterized protein n=1 Tax=Sphagnurus paluster TaxID=117069 RepID=A0A9P7K708_9AGAR|nr:hypothetical protein H0H81_001585 [Sphagnurus paluster]
MHPQGLDDDELEQIRRYEDFTTIGTDRVFELASRKMLNDFAQTGSRTLFLRGTGEYGQRSHIRRQYTSTGVRLQEGYGHGCGTKRGRRWIQGRVGSWLVSLVSPSFSLRIPSARSVEFSSS